MVATLRREAWRRIDAYAALIGVERNLFAWEWLRRTVAYRRAWVLAKRRGRSDDEDAARFGLVALEDPRHDAAHARPIWRADLDRLTVTARVIARDLPATELFDIRQIGRETHVAIDASDNEHWRLGDQRWSVRLDVLKGTLLGGPSQLSYRIIGLRQALYRTAGLQRLVALARGRSKSAPSDRGQRARWIAELRVADAIRAGASQQDIGRMLFRAALDGGDWRRENEAYRARVQRLVRAARRRLRDPVSADWFR